MKPPAPAAGSTAPDRAPALCRRSVRPVYRHRKALTLAALPIGLIALVLWQAWAAADDIVHPPRKPVDRTPGEFGVGYDDVAFTTADGLTLRGWYVPPSRADRALVIAQAGYGENRTKVITHTVMLARHGYGVLSFDWRAVGESEGEVSTVGLNEVRDVRAALAWLRERDDVNPMLIGALGQSAGAAAIIQAAAEDLGISAVVAETAFSALNDMLVSGIEQETGLPAFPFAPLIVFFGQMQSGANIDQVRPVEDIGRIAPRPVMIIRGGQDLWVPAFNADRLYAAAGEPKELWDAPDAGHSMVMEVYPEEYERRVVGFFDRHLRGVAHD